MNRFFRSALFPLVVIVLLVYLASQTLMPRRDNGKDLTYSQLIDETKKGNVSEVTFSPNRQSIEAVLDSGTKVKVNYPSPQSQAQYEQVLQSNNVTYDSKGIGTSAWWALLTGFLPVQALRGVGLFLLDRVPSLRQAVMRQGIARPVGASRSVERVRW